MRSLLFHNFALFIPLTILQVEELTEFKIERDSETVGLEYDRNMDGKRTFGLLETVDFKLEPELVLSTTS